MRVKLISGRLTAVSDRDSSRIIYEATTRAVDHYAATDLLRAAAEKEFGPLSHVVIRFTRGAPRKLRCPSPEVCAALEDFLQPGGEA